MKFRAIITNYVNMRELIDILTTFARINKFLVINIQPKKFIIQTETEVESGQCLWCEIDATSREGFFSDYVMDGVDQSHNQIFLTVTAISLVQALSYIRGNAVEYLKIKLAKATIACLAIEISGTCHIETDVVRPKVQHEVPVTVVPRSEWSNFELPLEMMYDLSMLLPSFKSLKGLIDKKKNISPAITVYCTLAGEFSLVVETSVVTVASHYKGLECARARTTDANSGDIREAACKVDSKKLANLLESIHFYDMKMFANIKNDQLLNIMFEMKDGVFLNLVLPAVDFE
ncbi:checkpoint protein HUS1 [Toxorhynchites rutilus septentrionalis]|uniref:checkpoint protein HUS1 n=1 Tax=Toxorhynchites rutilus septentrionalis TaxID=329112 RepID=UPI0024786DB6|nr:checkpoint protein HUS1 [Toxorhynchites rutilus septentrionalis]